jgi:hypothetical protein
LARSARGDDVIQRKGIGAGPADGRVLAATAFAGGGVLFHFGSSGMKDAEMAHTD